MLAAAMSVAILAALDERPSVAELASWIDFETLLLLFSMMVLVAVFSETGIFDYMSVLTYKLTNGRVWPLINTLCFFTFFLSSFLDNVTTALLMTPVTIRFNSLISIHGNANYCDSTAAYGNYIPKRKISLKFPQNNSADVEFGEILYSQPSSAPTLTLKFIAKWIWLQTFLYQYHLTGQTVTIDYDFIFKVNLTFVYFTSFL